MAGLSPGAIGIPAPRPQDQDAPTSFSAISLRASITIASGATDQKGPESPPESKRTTSEYRGRAPSCIMEGDRHAFALWQGVRGVREEPRRAEPDARAGQSEAYARVEAKR